MGQYLFCLQCLRSPYFLTESKPTTSQWKTKPQNKSNNKGYRTQGYPLSEMTTPSRKQKDMVKGNQDKKRVFKG